MSQSQLIKNMHEISDKSYFKSSVKVFLFYGEKSLYSVI